MNNMPTGNESAFGESLSAHAEESRLLLNPPAILLPCRGLILAHNRRGHYFREKDYHRWAAYCAQVHQCPKMDMLAWGRIPRGLVSTICYAREFDGVVSLRTDGSTSPEGLDVVAKEGLGDVFICPRNVEDAVFMQWLEACSGLGLPIRLQLLMPCVAPARAEWLASTWSKFGVRAVTVVLEDPFQPSCACKTPREGQDIIALCNALAALLPTRGIELTLAGFPRQLLDAVAAPYAVNARSLALEQQHYKRQTFLFAQRLFALHPAMVRSLLLLALKGHTASLNVTDRWLTEKLYIHSIFLHHAVLYAAKRWRSWRGTRLTRATHSFSGNVFQSPDVGSLGSKESKRVMRLLGLTDDSNTRATAATVDTEIPRPRYFDRFDRERFKQAELWQALAGEAREWERTVAPSRICDEKDWGTYEAFIIPEYGATAWLTSLSGKRLSTEIEILNPPFMVSVTVGGGIAEMVGFQLTPYCKILCPMVESRHTITLYVREDGRYVLLRDNHPVEPAQIPGEYPAPRRVPSRVKVHVVAWDIDERISFSPLRLWRLSKPECKPLPVPVYSIVVFCTRFARRLSAVLQCLAHQLDFDLSKLEVIVGYVPGLDATEDVLESLRLTHPELRVVHATFPFQNARSKGYVLNQCMEMAAGSYILLLDADTLLPPTVFATLERICADHPFIFPKGRAMLGPELTAKILQGDVRPWDDWNGLLESADESRENEALGVPIGYFQCFRRECLETLRYPEYEHFQGADYEFAVGLRDYFGEEHRLEFPVAHLDHSGSQWLGAERHF